MGVGGDVAHTLAVDPDVTTVTNGIAVLLTGADHGFAFG
jgi:hypothetical protein